MLLQLLCTRNKPLPGMPFAQAVPPLVRSKSSVVMWLCGTGAAQDDRRKEKGRKGLKRAWRNDHTLPSELVLTNCLRSAALQASESNPHPRQMNLPMILQLLLHLSFLLSWCPSQLPAGKGRWDLWYNTASFSPPDSTLSCFEQWMKWSLIGKKTLTFAISASTNPLGITSTELPSSLLLTLRCLLSFMNSQRNSWKSCINYIILDVNIGQSLCFRMKYMEEQPIQFRIYHKPDFQDLLWLKTFLFSFLKTLWLSIKENLDLHSADLH